VTPAPSVLSMTEINIPAAGLRTRPAARTRLLAHAGSLLILVGALAAARYEIPKMYQMVCGLGECEPGGALSFDRWTVSSLAVYGAALLLPFAVVLLLQLRARGRSRAGRFRIMPTIAVLALGWTVLVASMVGLLTW